MAFHTKSANAQEDLGPPLDRAATDEANVNLLSGQPVFTQTDLKIGHGNLSLTHTFSSYAGFFAGFYDNNYQFKIAFNPASSLTTVNIGGHVEYFYSSSGQYRSYRGSGSSLEGNFTDGFIYTDKTGMKLLTQSQSNNRFSGYAQLVYPNGFTVNFMPNGIETNNGLQFRYEYLSGLPKKMSTIQAVNVAYEYCPPASNSCRYNINWPKVEYTWPSDEDFSSDDGREITFKVKDPEGVMTHYIQKYYIPSFGPSRKYLKVIRVEESGSTQPNRTYDYAENYECHADPSVPMPYWNCTDPIFLVWKANINGRAYTYDFNFSSNSVGSSGSVQTLHGQGTGPKGTSTISAYHHSSVSLPTISQSSWYGTGSAYYTPDSSNRIYQLTDQGIKTTYEYGPRGNITKRIQHPASNSTPALSDIIQEAGYPDTCDNLKTCNKPLWTKDANGNVTDYEYHQESGQIRKITKPSDENGIRPVTHYQYEQKYARYYKNNATTIEQADSPIWLLTKEITCIAKAATETGCQAGDALTTTYEYGKDTEANNLWLTGTVAASASGESRRTCYEYDMYGNQIGEISPSANLTECP